MTRYGLLIDYHYCTNCQTCEVVCKKEHDIPIGKWGIKVMSVGPWPAVGDKYQLDHIPVPTMLCNLCGERVAEGKKPACVHNCQSQCMEFGPVDELAKKMVGKPKTVLFAPK